MTGTVVGRKKGYNIGGRRGVEKMRWEREEEEGKVMRGREEVAEDSFRNG